MANEEEPETPNPSASAEPPASDRTVEQQLVCPGYVVAEVYRRIERKLGLEGIRSDEDIAWIVQRRLPVRAIEALTLHGMSEREVYRLIVSRRSLAAHREKHEPLTCEESDRTMRIVRLTSLAEWVFGNDVAAGRWLRQPLSKEEPRTRLDFLRTEAGAWIIEVKLVQLAEGIFI